MPRGVGPADIGGDATAGIAAAEVVAAGGAGGTSLATWGGGATFLLDPVLSTPLRKDQVRIDLSEEFSRKVHPDKEVRCLVLRSGIALGRRDGPGGQRVDGTGQLGGGAGGGFCSGGWFG